MSTQSNRSNHFTFLGDLTCQGLISINPPDSSRILVISLLEPKALTYLETFIPQLVVAADDLGVWKVMIIEKTGNPLHDIPVKTYIETPEFQKIAPSLRTLPGEGATSS